MKRKHRGSDGNVALKIDIIKTYDRVGWSYLQATMLKMGFHVSWVNWMMMCVTIV